jgi:hypothetical protein
MQVLLGVPLSTYLGVDHDAPQTEKKRSYQPQILFLVFWSFFDFRCLVTHDAYDQFAD